ncbi:2-amino-4-hydroxy-6-hydroxymethyldihydropteridine diphosphokinase [Terrihabitans soli]|uniref:2-amino-4-hydroxy-6-hydroxymethyldihydropteridine pyrophosphokinase n=1 Tax=Terrihabitans soli TaxID=708113 RepID=A0A6S6QUS6_9HYPH|nr:2-amino-4-hydroxy-6-hydroxymethyldihydropteridine diphosphokinase [Terrihabitans soli]BCJ90258.1 2-amino-4-hydroxy-6-hydroxymethyldihydropteridine diphosphokinase [Terrihabitans soli]
MGSNLGDRAEAINDALRLLEKSPSVKLVSRSRLYETPPWGDENQDAFLNACALIETDLPPHDLLRLCLDIERRLGRDRTTSRRWGPRRIDLDLLFYGDERIADNELTLPHPHLFERAFVLVPLSEIAGARSISGRNVNEAADALDRSGVSLWDQSVTK